MRRVARWNDEQMSEEEIAEYIRELEDELAHAEARVATYLRRIQDDEQDMLLAEEVADALGDEDRQLIEDAEQIERREDQKFRTDLQQAREAAGRVHALRQEIGRYRAILDTCAYLRGLDSFELQHVTRTIQVLTETAEHRASARQGGEARKQTVALGGALTARMAVATRPGASSREVVGTANEVAGFMANFLRVAQQAGGVIEEMLRTHGHALKPFEALLLAQAGLHWPA